jgi:predicted ATPase
VRFQFGDFSLDEEQVVLTGPDGPIHVEPQVFDLLRHLIVNHERVVSKHELLDSIWGHRFVTESTLTSRVKAARRAVGDDGKAQQVIKTVHARGYRFVADVRTDAHRDQRGLPRLRNAPIGRDADIRTVIELLRDAPLATITGSGGIGKTTVALAVAAQLQASQAEGAVFVDLSPLPPQADVTRAVAEAAGVEGTAAESIERLAEHLASRPLLLVLDNCEHVLGGAAELVDRMLAQGETGRILATSREPLGVAGEHLWPLGPLHGAGPALFVQRARAAEPRVHWDPTDPAVIELCRRLDDVPLALELAAGQLRRFDLSELTRRLDDRLVLQWGTAASEAQRHATMETAIDWSYRILDPVEQILLRHLSVSPSSFDVDAVEGSAPPLEGASPLEVFGQLVDKSLVVRLPGTGRYRLLETIRAFSRERLEEADDAGAALERHRAQVRDRVSAASRLDRWMSGRLGAVRRADLDNARQAFRLSLATGDVEAAVEIAVSASFLWRNAMGCSEGDGWVASLEGLPLAPRDRLWVHVLRSDIGQGRGNPRQMFSAGAADTAEAPEDPDGLCLAAHYGALAHLTDADHAKDSLATAVDLAHRSGDARLVVLMQTYLVVADLTAGEHTGAHAALDRLDRMASEDGYDRFILHWAGWMLGLAEQQPAVARRWMDQQQDYLDRTGIVETWLTSFSTAMCDVLDGCDVQTALERTLGLAEREGYHAEADCVLVLAYAEICGGRFDAAAELVGTAMQGRFNATAHHVMYRAVLDHALRERLEPAALAEALERGRGRTALEALAAYGVTGRGPAR